MKIERAISVDELYKKRRNLLDFDGVWLAHIGKPELRGAWIIWGHSGSGKTSYALQLAKYLTKFERVAYNSLEMGDSQAFAEACKRTDMHECRRKFVVITDKLEDLTKRLKRQKSPNVIFIDSLQYIGLTYSTYKELIELFPNKLFVFISHADGKQPEGRVSKRVKYDAYVKVWVEGYTASAMSRYGGEKSYTVWVEGAANYAMDIQ